MLGQVQLIMPYNTYTTAAPTVNTYLFSSQGVAKVLPVTDFLQAFPRYCFCQLYFQYYLSDPFALTWTLNDGYVVQESTKKSRLRFNSRMFL